MQPVQYLACPWGNWILLAGRVVGDFVMQESMSAAGHLAKEERPWGFFEVLYANQCAKVKRLYVNPGHRLSEQRHAYREEHWVVVRGEPEITLNGVSKRYKYGDVIVIAVGSWHRLACLAGSEPVEIIETQVGKSFEENDIERRQDDYQRT